MGKLKLTVNEEKTRICKVPEGQFDFLGYTFGRMYSKTTGKARTWACGRRRRASGAWSRRSMTLTDLKTGWQETTEMVGKLNRTLRGWANYFQVGTVSRRIGRSTATPQRGCVGGCATSTRSDDAGAGPIHSRTYTGTSGSYV